MKTADGRTPGQVMREAFFAPGGWEKCGQAVLDAHRDQIKREGAVAALNYAADQFAAGISGQDDMISRCVVAILKGIGADIKSGDLKL